MKRNLLLTILLLIWATISYGTVYTALKSGNWYYDNIWDQPGSPSTGDVVIIPSGITVELADYNWWGNYTSVSEEISKLVIESDATLEIYAGSGWGSRSYLTIDDTLILNGNLIGDGTSSSSGVYDKVYIYFKGTHIESDNGLMRYLWFIVLNNSYLTANSHLTLNTSGFYIYYNVTFTNYGTIITDNEIDGYGSSSVFVNEANAFVSVGEYIMYNGVLVANATGNTVQYTGLYGNYYVTVPLNQQYYNLTIAAKYTLTLLDSLHILNDISIVGGVLDAAGNNLEVDGDWIQYSNFISDDSRVYFQGTAAQTIKSNSFANFSYVYFNNPVQINLSGDVLVTDTLRLNSKIYCNGNLIRLGRNADTVGVLLYEGGKIIGKFERWIVDSSVAYLYPIGTDTLNTFSWIKFPAISSPGVVSFEFIPEYPGNNGLPLADDTIHIYNTLGEGYWQADTSEGFSLGTGNTYDLQLKGGGFTSFEINDSTRILCRAAVDSAWQLLGIKGVNTPADSIVERLQVNVFPRQFALGDTTNCTVPLLTGINGPTDVCRGATDQLYVTDPTSDTYTFYWSVSGGVISQDNGDTVLINWDNDGQVATISVWASNNCSFGNTVTLDVNVHSIPPDYLNGLKAVPEGDTVIYTIAPRSNYSYSWSVSPNGQILEVKPTEDTAVITFPVPGTDTIAIVASYNNGACPSDTAYFPIFVYDVINSITSGDWGDPNTWDCNCIPQPTDNVRINAPHTVTLTGYYERPNIYVNYYEVNNVVISKGAVLSYSDGYFAPYGDLIVNGTLNYQNSYFSLQYSDKVLGGIGVINIDSLVLSGSRTVPSGSDLVINGDLSIDNNTLINNATLTVNGNLKSSDLGTFKNGYNATLNISGDLIPNGRLVTDTTGNTVNYNGLANQNVTPQAGSSQGYYNIVFSGYGTKSLLGDITVLNDLQILDSATLNANSFNITIYGDWYDYSIAADPFIEGTSVVTFNGTGVQRIYSPYIETFYDLAVGQNSVLRLSPVQKVTVSNNFTLDGILDLYYDTTNDTLASFIYKNDIIYGPGGKVRTTFIYNMKHWYELSPAIIGTNSRVFTNANGIFNRNLYWYDESVDLDGDPNTEPAGAYDPALLAAGWKFVTPTDDGVGVELKLNGGYLFYDQSDDTLIMEGQVAPLTAVYDTTLSFTNNDPDASSDTLPNFYDGWNIVGNPYIAYLSIDSLLNNATNVDNGIYVWDDVNDQYAGYQNGFRVLSGRLGPYIPPMQSFAVRANAAGAVLKIRPEYRVHANQIYLKNAPVNDYKRNAVKLGLQANGRVSYFATYFYPGVPAEFDKKYDMVYMAASSTYYPEVPNFYGKKGSVNVALEALPETLADSTIIPLYVEVGVSGRYAIKTDYINGLSSQFVLLRDLKTGDLIDLRTNPVYEFDYETTDDPHRFDLLIVVDNAPEITATIGDKIVYEDSSFTLDVTRYFTDKDNFDSLRFTVNNGGASWLAFDGKVLSGTPAQENLGKYTVNVSAVDIFGKTAVQSFDIEVLNTNDPPQLVNPLLHYTVKAGEKLTIDFSRTFTDIDPGDSLVYTLVGPDWITVDPYNLTLNALPIREDVGNYNVVLIATDKAGASAADTINITVLDNPLLDNSPVVVYPNPVVDKLNVIIGEEFDNASLTVWDLSGQKLRQIQLSSNNQQINLKDLQPGSYIIRVEYDGKVYKYKVSKQ